MAGGFMVPALLGVVLGASYRAVRRPTRGGTYLLYPLLLASLPYSLRSDAVFLFKYTLYPLIALVILSRLAVVGRGVAAEQDGLKARSRWRSVADPRNLAT
jgi:hypothetical protein